MKLIVTKEDLILDSLKISWPISMKRTFEEDEWHVINEFVNLNFFEDEEGFHANLYLVNDGLTITDTSFPIEIEFK
jgi:hypothetical protein